jgi:hypothetical protein
LGRIARRARRTKAKAASIKRQTVVKKAAQMDAGWNSAARSAPNCVMNRARRRGEAIEIYNDF